MTQIGKNIRALRRQAGLSQGDLAAMLCVSRQAVSSWENQKSQPDVEMLTAIAEALHVDVNALIYGMESGTEIREIREAREKDGRCKQDGDIRLQNENAQLRGGDVHRQDENIHRKAENIRRRGNNISRRGNNIPWRRTLAFLAAVFVLLSAVVYARRVAIGEGATHQNFRARKDTEAVMGRWYEQGAKAMAERMVPSGIYRQVLAVGAERMADLTLEGRVKKERLGSRNYYVSSDEEKMRELHEWLAPPNGYVKDDVALWHEIMTGTSYVYLVPEDIYDKVLERYGSVESDSPTGWLADAEDGTFDAICYPDDCAMRRVEIDGRRYYYRETPDMKRNGGFLEWEYQTPEEWAEFVGREADLIPEEIYQAYRRQTEALAAEFEEQYRRCSQMGLNAFAERWRQQLAEGLEKLERDDIYLASYEYCGCKKSSEAEGGWDVRYRCAFSNGYVGTITMTDWDGNIYLSDCSGEDGISVGLRELPGYAYFKLMQWGTRMRGMAGWPVKIYVPYGEQKRFLAETERYYGVTEEIQMQERAFFADIWNLLGKDGQMVYNDREV